jgi:Inovirus Coat protein B
MKFMNLRRFGARVGLVTVAALPVASFAVGPAAPDLSSLTPDFTTVTTGILAVAAAIAGVYVAWKGAKILIRAIKGA